MICKFALALLLGYVAFIAIVMGFWWLLGITLACELVFLIR
jgi:hypothetical protein